MSAFIKKIDRINFGLLSPEDIRRMSVVTVEYPDTYGDDGFPIDKGLMDPRMGVIDPNLVCRTCGAKGGVCQGHFGSIELARPVVHVGFGDVIHKILRSTCNECGRALLSDDEIKKYVDKILKLKAENKSISDILKEIYDLSNKKECDECPHCGAIQNKIILDKPTYMIQSVNPLCEFRKVFYENMQSNEITIAEIGFISQNIIENKEEYFQNKLLVNSNILEQLCEKLHNVDEIIQILDTENEIDESYELSNNQLNTIFKRIIDDNDLIEEYRLTPSEVHERLERIPDDDSFILGVNPEVARPEWLVLTVLPVPPVTVRPSITLETGERSEDDLTHKLVDVLRINQRLFENMGAGAPPLIVDDLWELLQYHVTTYFDNQTSGLPPARHRSGRPFRTLMQRFKRSKGEGNNRSYKNEENRGQFRENITGKYVNFSARSVISPDPNLSINEIGVPEMLAKELTVPINVTNFNIEEMKQYLINGSNVYPGANYLITGDKKRRVTEESKEFLIDILEPGHVIERHLIDGDVVLLNRQPSLHKLNLMAHEVKIVPFKTLRINPAICPPYNADFDGDEMNIHILQTYESRAEAKALMLAQDNFLSPRSGEPIIGAIRDHISGTYLLTRDGTTFSEEEALQIIKKARLQMPVFDEGQWILKKDSNYSEDSFICKDKCEIWTGKELFSLTLPNDLNISFNADISNNFDIHLNDVNVVISNGILLHGVIDETSIGSIKGKLLYEIYKRYGPQQAKDFLEKVISLSLSAIMKTGISNSINDYEVPINAQFLINECLDQKIEEVNNLVESYERGYLKNSSDIYFKNSLFIRISQLLNEARDAAGDIAENYFKPQSENFTFSSFARNSSAMAHIGEKSSMLNITQISACVGLQSIRGQSLGHAFDNGGYENRILPHFKKGELNAKSCGFVKSSFLKGLDPYEFFFHAIGGRDSMVDTSVRTANSGYMQRRLIYALQDLHTDKRGVVRDKQGKVIQMLYGEDGVDPVKSDFGKVADLDKLIEEIRMVDSFNNFNNSYGQSGFIYDENGFIYDKNLSEEEIKRLKIKSEYLSNKIRYILKDYADFKKEINLESEKENVYSNVNFKQIKMDLERKYQDFLGYINKCKNFNFLDEISEEVKNAYGYIDDIKNELYQNLSKSCDKKLDECDELIIKVNPMVTNKLTHLNQLELKLNELNNFDKQSFSDIYANDLWVELEKINDEFNHYFVNLNIIKNKLNEIDLNIFKVKLNRVDSYSDKKYYLYSIFKSISDLLNDIEVYIDELNQINLNDLERRINEHEKIDYYLKDYNKLIVSIDSLIKHYLNDFSNLYYTLRELIDKTSKLNDYINVKSKQDLFADLKLIENKLIQEFNKINTLDDFLNGYKSINFKDFDGIVKKFSELNKSNIYYKIKMLFDSETFVSQIIEQEKIYQELFENDAKLENNEDINSLIQELDYVLNNPFLQHDLRKFNLSKEQQDSIKIHIIDDIVNQKIVGENIDFKSIIISYYDEYSKNSNSLSDDELNEILSKIDLSKIDTDIVDECKSQVKRDYMSNVISKNQILMKFNILIDKKFLELKKLEELEKIKNNPYSPIFKQYLSEEDCILIYVDTEEKICSEYGLRESVYNFVEKKMYRKNEKNKSEAREEFKRFRYDRKNFFEITKLSNEEIDSFVRDVELLIGDNKIKANDFDEEFIEKLSLSFRMHGKVIL